jgi:hypothetical protein
VIRSHAGTGLLGPAAADRAGGRARQPDLRSRPAPRGQLVDRDQADAARAHDRERRAPSRYGAHLDETATPTNMASATAAARWIRVWLQPCRTASADHDLHRRAQAAASSRRWCSTAR